MSIYCDTSSLLRAYLEDEEGHQELRALIFDRETAIFTSELSRVEFASGIARVVRAGRMANQSAHQLLDAFDRDTSPDGHLSLLALESSRSLALARELVGTHDLACLDAIQLAVALLFRETAQASNGGPGPVSFCTRDIRQAAAAQQLGFVCC